MILINMLLKKLIKNLPKEKNKIEITGLEINSKKIKKGYIFFAIRGSKFNGEKYINEAVKKGAAKNTVTKKTATKKATAKTKRARQQA